MISKLNINTPNKKVLLITPGQPALNPRLVKEADALSNAGYQVTVIYAYWNYWGDDFTNKLLPTRQWKAIAVGGRPVKSPFIYFISKVVYTIAKLVVKIWGHVPYFADRAISRGSHFLITEAKKHQADIYIGHNLGTLPAIVKAAKKYRAKCGFDIEDFHRNETDDSTTSFKYKLTRYIEDKYLVQVDYITASSPQITNSYQQLYPGKHPVTILNVFPKSRVTINRTLNQSEPIKIVWFSQTIGKNRGLEDILTALKILNSNNFELHLLGNADNEIKTGFANYAGAASANIYFHAPIAPDDIVEFIAKFDIGLASEPGFSINNNLALSNKIFTYLQAGLAIIASDTVAQQNFLELNPQIGKLYPKKNAQVLADILTYYNLNREVLFNTCQASLTCGSEQYNRENESAKFLNLVNQTLHLE